MKEQLIKENWKAIEDAEKAVQERTGDPEAGFNAGTFFLSGAKQLLIPIKYRKKIKRKGKEDFTQSYKEIKITAKYCPFTGKPLFQEDKA